MTGKCRLTEDINKCPYFDTDGHVCNNTNKCTFQEKKESQKSYTRQERWYEKYYK